MFWPIRCLTSTWQLSPVEQLLVALAVISVIVTDRVTVAISRIYVHLLYTRIIALYQLCTVLNRIRNKRFYPQPVSYNSGASITATCTLHTRLMADDCYTKTVSFFFSSSFNTRSQHVSFRVVTRLDNRVDNHFSIRFQQCGSDHKCWGFIYDMHHRWLQVEMLFER